MLLKLPLILITFSSFAQATDLSSVDIANFHQTNTHLYRGGRPTSIGLSELKDLGVATIIDLQGGDLHSSFGDEVNHVEKGERPEDIAKEKSETVSLGMNFYNFPLDSMNKVTDEEGEWIDEALRIIADPAQQPVYIHCAHGKDRTGLVVALERVNQEEWAPKAARAEWIKYGHTRKSRVVTHDLDRYFFKVTSDNP